jgi:hypothetical protein
MLSTKLLPQSKPDMKLCLICGTNILLDHRMMDEHGLPIHTSCHEKQLLLAAATQQTDLWRRNLSAGGTA